jgi:hypothetical protein
VVIKKHGGFLCLSIDCHWKSFNCTKIVVIDLLFASIISQGAVKLLVFVIHLTIFLGGTCSKTAVELTLVASKFS